MKYNFFNINDKIKDLINVVLKITIIYILYNIIDDVKDKNIDNIDIIVFFDIANEINNEIINKINVFKIRVNIIFIINIKKNICIIMIMKKYNIDELKINLKIFLM